MKRPVIATLAVLALLAGAVLLVPSATSTDADADPSDPAAGELPGLPASVTAAAVGRFAVRAAWPAVAEAESYDLFARDIATGAVIGPVPAVGTTGEVPFLTLGHQFQMGVRARNDNGVSETVWSPGSAYSLPNWAPTAVTNVQAVASPTSTRITVSWTNPANALEADSYLVGVTAPEGYLIGSYATCDFPCSSRTVDGLEPGTYGVRVAPLSWSGGIGQWTVVAPAVTVDDRCADGGACLAVDASSDRGPATLRAQGLNASLWGVDPEVLRPLKLQNIRGAASWTYQTAQTLGADFTWVLSNTWYEQRIVDDGKVERPWEDWANYENWAAGTALSLDRRSPVDYIDVQNEPYVAFFPDDQNLAYTPDVIANQVEFAAEGIRLGDPDAKVVGPSFGGYTDRQLRNFMDYAVLGDFHVDALNWHELSAGGGSVDRIPSDLIEHVANVRSMLTERPSLGAPEIHVNEYTEAATGRLAGWGAGFIAALEQADVDLAMRSCADGTTCPGGAELVDADGQTTLAPYWVHRFYAEQTGRRLVTDTSNGNVTSFATRDGDTVRVLVGRHNTCLPAINSYCINSALVTQPAYDVPVTVTGLTPDEPQLVTIQRIPATMGPVQIPISVSETPMRVAPDGTLRVTLPAVADGEAWTVTVTPRITPAG